MSTISKSKVMKRAWQIYRGTSFYSGNFSYSLKRAWEIEKQSVEYTRKEEERRANELKLKAYRESKPTGTIRVEMPADYLLAMYRENRYMGD